MTDKRRNLLILGVVIALLAASATLAVVRDFRLGLDLRGGIEIVLEARPEKGVTVNQDILNQSADILRRRIDPQGVLSPEIRTSASDKSVTVAVPGIKDPRQAAELLVSSGQLQSFNLFKFLRYIAEEILIVLGTSSSESVLPRLMTKMERLGCARYGS